MEVIGMRPGVDLLCKKYCIMKKNMGVPDRLIRLLIAAVVVALYLMNVIAGTLAIVLLIVAGVFVLTSIAGFCPLYSLFGVNTCPKRLTPK